MFIHECQQWYSAGYGLDDWRFESRQGLGIFLFTASRPALGLTQPPTQWTPGAYSLGVKRPVREADHSPPTSADVKECVELYLHFSNTPSWRGAHDNFTYTFTRECQDDRVSIAVLVIPNLVVPSVGNGMPILKGGLFPLFPNFYTFLVTLVFVPLYN
jgi:hypothetical protein